MEAVTTIRGLFSTDRPFVIPSYQRAYSWKVGKDGRDGQVDMYLNDIIDQSDDSNYFLGHYLFEKLEKEFDIIDGQQRLTTTIIFMSRLVYVLRKRKIEKFEYKNKLYYTEELYDHYLKPRYGNQKFQTVSDDKNFFDKLIIQCPDIETCNINNNIERRSEKRILDAAIYFDKKMQSQTEETLYKWLYIIDNAVITTFELIGENAKLTATQIFAFQNDRGLSLTTLEKLKAFLMHQVYRNSRADAIYNIRSLEGKFASIYNYIEKLKTDEDTVLGYHCSAFLSISESSLVAIKRALQRDEEKIQWINNFTDELCRSYSLMCEIENTYNFISPIADVCLLDKANAMPLVLKLCHYNSKGSEVRNIPAIDNALNLVEKILFKLTYTVDNYRTNNLIKIANEYKPDGYDDLMTKLKNSCDGGFQYYWNFNKSCLEYFTVKKFHYHKELRYILYKYENSLRAKDGLPELTPAECSNIFRDISVQNTLDHITPQNPDFTEYTQKFRDEYLHNIGNLSLLTWGNNASKSNHNPASEEIMKFYDSVYLSHKEIYKVLESEKQWDEKQIVERRDRIIEFIKKKWLD